MKQSFDLTLGNYAVVTGASSGIGACLALCLAAEGYDLILVARREDRLRKLADKVKKKYGKKGVVLTADLSRKKECFRVLEAISEYPYSMFVNNAGFGACGAFSDTELDTELSMLNVNIRALHILTKGVLRHYQKIGGGYLLNVASSAGLMPAGPYMSVYYATKVYVTSLTLAIARELEESGSNVYIGALCPGPVDTEFNNVANVAFSLKGITPERCADYAIRQMKKKKTVIIPEKTLKFATVFGRLLPRRAYVGIIGHQQTKKLPEST